MGALSENYGVHGFEKGFLLMAASYVVGALFVMYGFFFSFRNDRIVG
jgi:vacuolar-type H+-ATPase subunit I/STV1